MRKELEIMLTPHDCEKETAKCYWSLFGSAGRKMAFAISLLGLEENITIKNITIEVI